MLFLLLPLFNRNYYSFCPCLIDPFLTSIKGDDSKNTGLKKKKETIRKTGHHKKDKPN